MSPGFYRLCWLACRFAKFQCIREVVVGAQRINNHGPVLLACTHISHLEPFVVGTLLRRNIRWMSRVEFYRNRLAAAVLNLGGAFPVDRFGNAIPAVREAIALLNDGQVVGIFPEGGVATGEQSVLRGAKIKQGVCTVAVRTRVPVIPVVILGTDKLNRVGPWVPFRRGRVLVAFGQQVAPPPASGCRGDDRREMAARLEAEFVRTYQDLLQTSGLLDSDVP